MDPSIRGNALVVISLPSRIPYESFLGKIIGCIDYVGAVLLFLYNHYFPILVTWVVGVVISLATAVLWQ